MKFLLEVHGLSENRIQDIISRVSDELSNETITIEVLKDSSNKEICITALGDLISIDSDDNGDTLEICFNRLVEASTNNGGDMSDDYVTMWEPLEHKYTVNQLLKEIGYKF